MQLLIPLHVYQQKKINHNTKRAIHIHTIGLILIVWGRITTPGPLGLR